MPAIKLKKATQDYIAEKEREKEAKAALSKTPPSPSKQKKAEDEKTSPVKHKPKVESDVEILYEKRKRTIPPTEQKLITWLDINLEKKEGVFLGLPSLYECYTEACLLESCNVCDILVFNKYVREKFGKEYSFKDDSAYNGQIKERKAKDKKEKKVVAESLQLKIRDIIEEVIKEKGNPNKGLRFPALQRLVGQKYPALQVEVYPSKLLTALDRGVRSGYVILVKGVRKSGYYRLYGESTAEEDIKAEEQKAKIKKEKEEKRQAKEAALAAEENGEEAQTDEGEQTPKKSKKSRKRKSTEETDENEDNKIDEPSKKKKAKSGKKKKGHRYRDSDSLWQGAAATHSQPRKIQDTFPMAITFMSDPKETSVARIKKYISDHNPSVNLEKVKKILEKGIEKGLWMQVSGSGVGNGTFRLLAEDFEPSETENIEDMISQALVACNEPKHASAGAIKKYIMQYHPDLGVESKYHFKKALERAANKNQIRQLSGIGATGSFQLISSFVPSPAILAGDVDAEIEEKTAVVADREFENFFEDKYQEHYVVRKTKSGRMGGRLPVTVISKQPQSKRRR